MLKDTRLLIGLGIGLIIGALLLELMNVAITGVSQDALSNEINNGTLTEKYTLEQLKDIADSLDYNIIEKSVVYYTQGEMDEAIVKAKKSAIAEPVTDPKQPIVTEPVVKEPVVKEPEVVGTAEKVVNGNTTTYRIRIETGMVTANVTELLLTVGLISDVDSFKKELNRRKLNESIQVGMFEFTTKPSLTELINKITSH
ncbi:MAG: hypothetical protein WDZ91_13410 [Paenibacillaceae bacterium]